jgi:Pregnancy-associated plasma protein-A
MPDKILNRPCTIMKSIIALLLSILSISSLAQSPTEPTVYIPVVVHVIDPGQPNDFPTDLQIIDKITELNNVFNGTASFLGNHLDIGIQFRLAKVSPDCIASTGIDIIDYSTNYQYRSKGVRLNTFFGISETELKIKTRWEPLQYLNIWVVNKIDGLDTGAYTRLPKDATGKDGIIITSSDFLLENSPILTKQIGRFFNLYTLSELLIPNASVFCGDDAVVDTDPVEEYKGAARTGNNPCSNNPYNDKTEFNFMSDNNIRNQFTQGQKERMRESLKLSNRAALVNSKTDEIDNCLFNSQNTPIFSHNSQPVKSFKT